MVQVEFFMYSDLAKLQDRVNEFLENLDENSEYVDLKITMISCDWILATIIYQVG